MFNGGDNYKDMIRGAVARGYVVYAPHLVTYSPGDEHEGAEIAEDGRQQLDKQLRQKGASLTGVETTRIARALDALTRRPEVDRNRIAMIGLSLGGSTTLAMAALDERIKVAVVACGYRYAAIDAASPLTSSQLISAIAPRPLQIQAGRRDPLVSIQIARPADKVGAEIYGKADVKDRFAFEEFDGGHEFNGALAFAFLQKYL
jgi:dienelactone hydrolase